MANVLFKRGLQASLPTTGIDGAFYLTTDTHRLYMGYGGGVHQVNPGITKVANIAALPQANQISSTDYGQFYYATAENILCIYDGTEWKQVNPDTDTVVHDLLITATAADNVATVNSLMNLWTNGQDSGKDVTGSFQIEGTDGLNVTASGSKITIAGDPVTLSGDAANNIATISLDSRAKDSSVKIAGGENVTITKEDDGSLKISSSYENNDTKNASLEVAPVAEGGNGFDIKVTDTAGHAVQDVLDPTVKINSSSVHYVNGVADLTNLVYDKSEIDGMMKGFQAMEYQGKISSLPTSNVKIGYTYLAESEIEVGTETAKVGDTLIARGVEGADGYITGSITWDIIPSGDDIHRDTVVSGATIDDGFKLTNSTGSGADAEVIEFAVKAGTNLVVADAPEGKKNVVTVSHDKVARTDTTGAAQAQNKKQQKVFNLVTGVTSDDQGHITGVETSSITVEDTVSALVQSGETGYVATSASSANAKEAAFSFTTKVKDGAGTTTEDTRSLELGTDSLAFSAKNNKVHIDLVWEEWS